MQERADAGILDPDTMTQKDGLEEKSLEELFAEAEDLIGRMEEPDLSLEDAFEAYAQGMKIIRACNSRIDQVEQKMLMMNAEGELEPFGDNE